MCNAYNELGTDHRLRVPYFKFLAVFNKQVGSIPSEWPTLSCKAASSRHCLAALHKACENIAHDYEVTTPEFRLQRYLLRKAVRLYTIMDQHGHHMPRDAGEECFQCVKAFLRTQNALGQHYRNKERPLLFFHATFKSHYMWHFGYSCQYFNPRCGWCYRDESFVGRIARVAKSAVAGLGAKKVAVALAKKWRWVLQLRMWQRQWGI